MTNTYLFEEVPCAIYKDGALFKTFDSRAECAKFLGVKSQDVTKTIKRNGKLTSKVDGIKYPIRNYKEKK